MTIHEHQGKKYLRKIYPADGKGEPILVDIYSICKAYKIESAAISHCLKKLLAPGQRGIKGEVEDLQEAISSIQRAIEQLQEGQEEPKKSIPTPAPACEKFQFIPHQSHFYYEGGNKCSNCGVLCSSELSTISCTKGK